MHCDVRCPCLVIAVYSTGATGRAIVLSPFLCLLLRHNTRAFECALNSCFLNTRAFECAFVLSESLATPYPVKSDRFDRAQDGDTLKRQFSNFEASKIPYKRALVSLKLDISINEDINKHISQTCFLFHIHFKKSFPKIGHPKDTCMPFWLKPWFKLHVSNHCKKLNDHHTFFVHQGPYWYELFSIMIHSGSASGGHYYAYIK